ncbi:MAG: hypothetical protein IPK60_00620 [Sandaracinaceae bacterium]|nr:hypothetical protein [Sandaracinaceae bacterium]
MTKPHSVTGFPAPAHARSAPSIADADGVTFGEPAIDLAALVRADVPIARGWVLALGGSEWRDELLQLVESALVAGASRAHISIWFATRDARARFSHLVPDSGDVTSPQGARDVIALLATGLGEIGNDRALSDIAVRVSPVSSGLFCYASSADPTSGDPDTVSVCTKGAVPWLVDRRTMRLARSGGAPIDEDAASRAADLADRAQLVLGRPVEIECVLEEGRTSIASVRRLSFVPRFTSETYRRVRFLPSEEGSVAPLAIDAMAKALRVADAPFDETRMRRVYARPYRRMESPGAPLLSGSRTAPIARAASRLARIAVDVATPVAAARRYEDTMRARAAGLDAINVHKLDAAALVAHIEACQIPVIEGLTLLDRTRLATLAILPALEAMVGNLPRESFSALAAPRATRFRMRVDEKLRILAHAVTREKGDVTGPQGLSAQLRNEWDKLRRDLYNVRPIGLDVTPEAYGAHDLALARGLASALAASGNVHEAARAHAVNEISALAREQSFGAPRFAVVRSVMMVMERLADAKGRVSEGLTAALLRLRRAACQAGERLVDEGILESPEDALYMDLSEIEQALTGEPGAYAARVRLRREDDARWTHFEAPIRLHSV